MVKVWKSGGPEDKAIKNLIKEGKVTRYTKPTYLQNEHSAIFKDFTIGVIRNHLTDVKRQCGLFIGDDIMDTEEDLRNDVRNDVSVLFNKEEDEEKVVVASSSGLHDTITGYEKLVHRNYPIVCKSYTDPDTEAEKLLLVISMPGGAEKVKVDVTENGLSAIIKYEWAKSMYDVTDLFKKEFDQKVLTSHHPLISCYKAGLAESRKRINSAPASSMKIDFPIQVQKNPGSWKKWGVFRDDGTQVLIATFTGLVKEYELGDAEEVVKFEK